MRTRHKHGLAAGAAVLAVLIAAPAIGAAGSDPPVQPPPGTVVRNPGPAAPVPAQPPAGAPAVKVTKVAPVPRQPVNLHPKKAGPPLTLQHSKHDKGARHVPFSKDRGKKNLPIQPDLGDR